MTDRQLNNRIEKINSLEKQIEEMEALVNALRDEIKADLTEKKVDEHNTGSFVIRWKEVISNRLDSKALKAALPDVFTTYNKESRCRRFTINAA